MGAQQESCRSVYPFNLTVEHIVKSVHHLEKVAASGNCYITQLGLCVKCAVTAHLTHS